MRGTNVQIDRLLAQDLTLRLCNNTVRERVRDQEVEVVEVVMVEVVILTEDSEEDPVSEVWRGVDLTLVPTRVLQASVLIQQSGQTEESQE